MKLDIEIVEPDTTLTTTLGTLYEQQGWGTTLLLMDVLGIGCSHQLWQLETEGGWERCYVYAVRLDSGPVRAVVDNRNGPRAMPKWSLSQGPFSQEVYAAEDLIQRGASAWVLKQALDEVSAERS